MKTRSQVYDEGAEHVRARRESLAKTVSVPDGCEIVPSGDTQSEDLVYSDSSPGFWHQIAEYAVGRSVDKFWIVARRKS